MSHSNNSEENIKEQIKKAIKDNNFAGYRNSDNQSEFSRLANQFIDATTYKESTKFAQKLIYYVLSQNDKGDFASSIKLLDITEMNGNYSYGNQRRHYIHQMNVYLLGLFLYHNSQIIRDNIKREMESTTSKIEIDIDGVKDEYQYSGGSEFHEFCYRWKLASLPHDIGYGVSLFGNDENEMIDYIQKTGVTNISNIDDLWLFDNTDLRSKLSCIQGIDIKKYMDNQCETPSYGTDYYDHGIISSLIFLRCMIQEYAKHSDNSITKNNHTHIIWDKSILSGSICQVAIAIAHHNLDIEKLESSADNIKIFDLEKNPLLWLLKVSDIIQEWDKPKVNDGKMENETIEQTNIQILDNDDKLTVKNFPSDKSEDVKNTISKYTNPSDLIEIFDTKL